MKNKIFYGEIKSINEEEKLLIGAIASTGREDRHKERINPKGWKLDNYLKNPVVLFSHKYNELPIGKAIKIYFDKAGNLLVDIKFATHRFAEEVWGLVKEGFLKGLSVGFLPLKYGSENDEYTYLEQELLEISLVPVPANPEALIKLGISEDKIKNIDEIYKEAVGFKEYELDEKSDWDGDKARDQLAKWATSDGSGDKDKIDWDKYKLGFAWYDEENKEDFSSYKLPHHYVKDGKLITVWSGVKSAMGALLGARGGVKLDDKEKVYNHLVKHYKSFKKEPPELRSYNILELATMFGGLYEEEFNQFVKDIVIDIINKEYKEKENLNLDKKKEAKLKLVKSLYKFLKKGGE